MSKLSRILVAAASLLLVGLYFFPLWSVHLTAPQYPEGLGMYIHVNTIRGLTEFDLDKINGLNHYIGMKPIVPDAIPELRFMPWLVGALIAGGLLVAALGRRWALYAWVAAFAALGVAGLVDFWRWEYDYGHDLAPDAIIKVPGMSYQPPLIGSKALLNFVATSWPALGGWLAGLAFALGAVAALLTWRAGAAAAAGTAAARVAPRGRGPRPTAAARRLLSLLVLLAVACRGSDAPHPIAYGHDACDYCRMTISDPRYGAELVTTTGKVHEFDSIECLAAYFLQARAAGTMIRAVWVSDFEHPGTFVPVADARFLRSSGPGSPMGQGLTAFGPGADTAALARRGLGGAGGPAQWLRWDDVLAAVEREAVPAHHGAGAASAHGTAQVPATAAPREGTVEVSPDGPVRTVAAAIALARPGGRVVVHPGVYREPTIVVDKPVEIVGRGLPLLDGEGQRGIMTITASGVTVRGLRFANVGTSYTEDRAAIRVVESSDCVIEGNKIDEAFFGIYLARVTGCRIVGNELRASKTEEFASGNGIHLWTSSGVTIADNHVVGHRDGIYFEFVRDSEVRGNVSEGNLRYGLHFMYSDDCRYLNNTFQRNGAGVAVMYTRHVEMVGNRFERNWGGAAYGLLLKEISDVRLERNRFYRNSTGLLADGTTRLVATGNEFLDNGWALRLDANAQEAQFGGNDFAGNTFDVATNGRESSTAFDGNYFDGYEGYDLDRDGYGDVPHRPVRLFSLVVEQHEPALILLRSFFVGVLDAAERLIPSLTPEAMLDRRPAMRRHYEGMVS